MNKKQKGYLLVELLMVIAVIITISAISAPNVIQVRNGAEILTAKRRLQQVWQMEGGLLVCQQLTPSNCGGLTAMTPRAGSITNGGYTYTYTVLDGDGHWSYVATPRWRNLPTITTDYTGTLNCNGVPCQ